MGGFEQAYQDDANELCAECFHPRARHWMALGLPGTCSVSVDRRHVTAGGPQLEPCGCAGYVPPGTTAIPVPTAEPDQQADELVVLRERRDWLTARIAAKTTVGWDTRWDTRERDALAWAIDRIEAAA